MTDIAGYRHSLPILVRRRTSTTADCLEERLSETTRHQVVQDRVHRAADEVQHPCNSASDVQILSTSRLLQWHLAAIKKHIGPVVTYCVAVGLTFEFLS